MQVNYAACMVKCNCQCFDNGCGVHGLAGSMALPGKGQRGSEGCILLHQHCCKFVKSSQQSVPRLRAWCNNLWWMSIFIRRLECGMIKDNAQRKWCKICWEWGEFLKSRTDRDYISYLHSKSQKDLQRKRKKLTLGL